MSLSAIQKAELRNSELIEDNAELRRELAILARKKATVDRQLIEARRKLAVSRDACHQKLEKMEWKMAKMRE
jgi:hypothetical protein